MNHVKFFFIRAFMLTTCLYYSGVINAYDFEIDGIYYSIISLRGDTYAEVTYGPNKYSGDITIPESVSYNNNTYVVQSIHGSFVSGAFQKCDNLISVNIPNSVTSIGYYAFADCSKLESVILPNSLKWLYRGAFSGCISLKSIIIPNKVERIENNVFNGCSSLKSVELYNNIKSIEEGAFYGCTNLSSINIPENVTKIDSRAFANCNKLHDVFSGIKNPFQYQMTFLKEYLQMLFYMSLQVLKTNILLYLDGLPFLKRFMMDLIFCQLLYLAKDMHYTTIKLFVKLLQILR